MDIVKHFTHTIRTMNIPSKIPHLAFIVCTAISSVSFAETPLEQELQKLQTRHETALKELRKRASEANDAKAAQSVDKTLASSVKKPTLEQTMSNTRWTWWNGADFTGDVHWIEFYADGTAKIPPGWPLKWSIEGPATVLVRRTDNDDFFLHFQMDMTKLEGVADPRFTRSHDPRSIRFERRIPEQKETAKSPEPAK